MKRLLLGILLCWAAGVAAQNSKRTSAYNYMNNGVLDKAKASIDQAVKHPKTRDDAKTWFYRGQIYMKIKATDKQEYQRLSDNPGLQAYQSFSKVIELDDRERYAPNAANGIVNLSLGFFNSGVKYYNEGFKNQDTSYFSRAYQDYKLFFESMHRLPEKYDDPLMQVLEQNDIDTQQIRFNMAVSAEKAARPEKADAIYKQLAQNQYQNSYVYRKLSQQNLQTGDTAQALKILEMGREAMPKNKDLALAEADLYLQMGRSEELLGKLKDALELNPDNTTIKLSMADTYMSLDSTEKAMNIYNEVLEKDGDNFYANLNKGILLYNMAADFNNQSMETDSRQKQSELNKKAKQHFKQAMPYLEKAHNLKPKDPTPIRPLKEIYVRLGMEEKADALSAQ